MALDIDLVRTSFATALSRDPDLTRHFYQDLFDRHPEARRLFGRHAPEVQERMLANTLVAAVEHLDDAPWLRENLAELGARHAGYGVTAAMYGWVGESLLATLRRAAGDDWTNAHQDAWTEVYETITQMMLDGQSSAERATAPTAT
jgi:hemoglobin-like flavoprotein